MKTIVPLLLAGAALLGGCATGYQKATAFSFTGGFREADLGRNVHRVAFSANGYTTAETAQCFWLYRCAELALEQGATGFEILSDIRLVRSLPPHEAFGLGPTVELAQYYPIFIPMDNMNKPYIEADVLLLFESVTPNPPKVFDARLLKAALEPHVAEPMKKRGNVKPHVHDYLLPPNKLGGSA